MSNKLSYLFAFVSYSTSGFKWINDVPRWQRRVTCIEPTVEFLIGYHVLYTIQLQQWHKSPLHQSLDRTNLTFGPTYVTMSQMKYCSDVNVEYVHYQVWIGKYYTGLEMKKHLNCSALDVLFNLIVFHSRLSLFFSDWVALLVGAIWLFAFIFTVAEQYSVIHLLAPSWHSQVSLTFSLILSLNKMTCQLLHTNNSQRAK